MVHRLGVARRSSFMPLDVNTPYCDEQFYPDLRPRLPLAQGEHHDLDFWGHQIAHSVASGGSKTGT